MKFAPITFCMAVMVSVPAFAQPNARYAGGSSQAQGTSVAYGQPLFYVQRLGPSQYYPPSRYGYVVSQGQRSGYSPYRTR